MKSVWGASCAFYGISYLRLNLYHFTLAGSGLALHVHQDMAFSGMAIN